MGLKILRVVRQRAKVTVKPNKRGIAASSPDPGERETVLPCLGEEASWQASRDLQEYSEVLPHGWGRGEERAKPGDRGQARAYGSLRGTAEADLSLLLQTDEQL